MYSALSGELLGICQLNPAVDCAVKFCILADFLLVIVLFVMGGRHVLNYNVHLSVSPFSSIIFVLCILRLCCLVHLFFKLLCFPGGPNLLSSCNAPSIPLIFFFLLYDPFSFNFGLVNACFYLRDYSHQCIR